MYDILIENGYFIGESLKVTKKNIAIKDNLIEYVGNKEMASNKEIDATNFII